MILDKTEQNRYARHLVLPDFGVDSQIKLADSKVLVIGAGGLGAPILQYLAAAGVGTIGIVEYDHIDLSNLQRQVLYKTEEVGLAKGDVAKRRLNELNPLVKTIWHNGQLSTQNARQLIQAYDIVIDGSDNFPTRYLVNDACYLENKALVYGSVHQFEGQVSVFNYRNGPNYRDLFPIPPTPDMAPNCAEGGVLGVLPGIIGSMQALECIKILAGIGEVLSGKLYVFNALDFTSHTVKINKDPNNELSGDKPRIKHLNDYEAFCQTQPKTKNQMKEIDVKTLANWKETKRDFVLIDVRETYEYEQANLGGLHIPLADLEAKKALIPKDKEVVMICRSGVRSANAIRLLNIKYDYSNLLNLKGGIMAWSEQIDSDLDVA